MAAAGHKKPFKNGFLGYYRPLLGPGVIGGKDEVVPVMDLGENAVNLPGRLGNGVVSEGCLWLRDGKIEMDPEIDRGNGSG